MSKEDGQKAGNASVPKKTINLSSVPLITNPPGIAPEENGADFMIVDGQMYNSKGYKICGYLNQHNQPCQRIGRCPFHDGKEKKDGELPKNLKIVHRSSVVKKKPYKRGWSKDEHYRFLTGLQIHGKGAWKEISQLVKTRNPTQIQSHAQKYYARQKQKNKTKKSIHDFTIEDLKDLTMQRQKLANQINQISAVNDYHPNPFVNSPNPPVDLSQFVQFFANVNPNGSGSPRTNRNQMNGEITQANSQENGIHQQFSDVRRTQFPNFSLYAPYAVANSGGGNMLMNQIGDGKIVTQFLDPSQQLLNRDNSRAKGNAGAQFQRNHMSRKNDLLSGRGLIHPPAQNNMNNEVNNVTPEIPEITGLMNPSPSKSGDEPIPQPEVPSKSTENTVGTILPFPAPSRPEQVTGDFQPPSSDDPDIPSKNSKDPPNPLDQEVSFSGKKRKILDIEQVVNTTLEEAEMFRDDSQPPQKKQKVD